MSTYVSDANFVVLMVLLAAAMQAAWNISVKSSASPYLTLTEINVTVGMVAIPLLLVSRLPDQRAFLWIGLGVVIRQAYYVTLSFAYKHNDFGLVYPLVRGLNPVLITVLGVVFLDDTLGVLGASGIMMVVAGVLINAAAKAGTFIRPDLRSLATCLAVSVQVSVFTLFDGFGVRSSDAASPAAYAATLAICDGLVSLTISLFYRSLHRLRPEAAQIRLSLLGGTLAALSFWIGIWAISMAPLGMVSALRESSILFAVVFSAFLLKERLSVGRIAGSATILLGIILIKFSV